MEKLARELAGAEEELTREKQTNASLTASHAAAMQGVQEEVGGLQEALEAGQTEREELERTNEEQETELVKLRLKMSDLELHKESLLFQSATNERTIASLQSQVNIIIM